MQHLESNIKSLRWIHALRFFDPLLPIFLIYITSFNISYTLAFTTQIAFAFTLACLELPLGIVCDMIGRKKTLIFGAVFATLGGVFFAFMTTVTGFIIAEILLAVSFAAFSGADTALLFESCKQTNQSHIYLAKEAELQAFGRYSEAISGILSGLLMSLATILPAITNLISSILALVLTQKLEDTATHSKLNTQSFRKEIKKRYHNLISNIKHNFATNKKLWLLILYSGLISTTTLSSFWLLQAYYKIHHLNLLWLGVIWFIYHSSTGVASQLTSRLTNILDQRRIFFLLPILLSMMAVILGITKTPWAMPCLLISSIVFGIKMPFIYNIIHQKISDNSRASIISVDSLTTRLLFSVTAIALGLLIDHISLQAAFLFLLLPITSAAAIAFSHLRHLQKT